MKEIFVLCAVIVAGAGAVYFIRRGKTVSETTVVGDDFEILDE